MNIVLVKYDASGNALWARTVVSGHSSEFHGVAVDPAGNVYAAGTTRSDAVITFDPGVGAAGNSLHACALLVKYDAAGNAVWARTGAGPSDAAFDGVAVDAAGNVGAAQEKRFPDRVHDGGGVDRDRY